MKILSDIVAGIFLTYILIFYQAILYPTRILALSSRRIYENSIWHCSWHFSDIYSDILSGNRISDTQFWLFLADVYMNILSDIVAGIFLTYILIFYQAIVYPTRILALSSRRIYEHSIWHCSWHFFWHIFWYSIRQSYIRHAFWLFLADVYMNILSDIVAGIFLTYILIFYQAIVYPTRILALSSRRIYENSIWHCSWHFSDIYSDILSGNRISDTHSGSF